MADDSGETPFRYWIVDDAISPALVRAVDAFWPKPDDPGWHIYESGKRATRQTVPPAARPVLLQLATLPLIAIRYPEVFPDWSLNGAGLHEMPPGVELGLHLDADHVPTSGYRRRLSAVLFATPGKVEGGELLLHNPDGSVARWIPPAFNRLVLFECGDASLHSVARVQGSVARRSVALFFCDNERGGVRDRADFDPVVTPAGGSVGGGS